MKRYPPCSSGSTGFGLSDEPRHLSELSFSSRWAGITDARSNEANGGPYAAGRCWPPTVDN